MNNGTQGQQGITLAAGGKTYAISLQDLADMKASLVRALQSSQVEDKSELLQRTQGAEASIDADGNGRIGGWLLNTRGSAVVLSRRVAMGQESAKGYVASLTQQDGKWVVTEVTTERIRLQR